MTRELENTLSAVPIFSFPYATVGSSLQNGNKGKKKKDSTTDSSETSMVFFRGSMIDLDKLHQQLAVSESSTRHIKEKLVETEAEIERVKSRKMQLEKNALKDGTEIETLQATLNTATGEYSNRLVVSVTSLPKHFLIFSLF